MLNLIKSLFARKPAAVAPMLDDIPAHKGFVATVKLAGGYSQSATFKTLKEAQVWVFQRKQFTAEFMRPLNRKPAKRAYFIKNLETGKFSPYVWQLCLADLA